MSHRPFFCDRCYPVNTDLAFSLGGQLDVGGRPIQIRGGIDSSNPSCQNLLENRRRFLVCTIKLAEPTHHTHIVSACPFSRQSRPATYTYMLAPVILAHNIDYNYRQNYLDGINVALYNKIWFNFQHVYRHDKKV